MGRSILGIILIVIGILICLFGGIGLAIKAFIDVAKDIDNDTLTMMSLIKNVIWFFLRDAIAWTVGIIMMVIGVGIVKE